MGGDIIFKHTPRNTEALFVEAQLLGNSMEAFLDFFFLNKTLLFKNRVLRFEIVEFVVTESE